MCVCVCVCVHAHVLFVIGSCELCAFTRILHGACVHVHDVKCACACSCMHVYVCEWDVHVHVYPTHNQVMSCCVCVIQTQHVMMLDTCACERGIELYVGC